MSPHAGRACRIRGAAGIYLSLVLLAAPSFFSGWLEKLVLVGFTACCIGNAALALSVIAKKIHALAVPDAPVNVAPNEAPLAAPVGQVLPDNQPPAAA